MPSAPGESHDEPRAGSGRISADVALDTAGDTPGEPAAGRELLPARVSDNGRPRRPDLMLAPAPAGGHATTKSRQTCAVAALGTTCTRKCNQRSRERRSEQTAP